MAGMTSCENALLISSQSRPNTTYMLIETSNDRKDNSGKIFAGLPLVFPFCNIIGLKNSYQVVDQSDTRPNAIATWSRVIVIILKKLL